MKIRNPQGYQTCLHSRKRRVTSGCDNRARLFTGRHYELPNHTVCIPCPFYCKDKSSSSKGRDG